MYYAGNNRYCLIFSPAVEKLELVECDLERDAIGPAIGNSSIVICCIGASEKEVFDFTGPYRIDYQAAKRLVDAGTRYILQVQSNTSHIHIVVYAG